MEFSSISKINGKVVQGSNGRDIVIHGPSVVRLKLSPEKVARYVRRGEDLVLQLADGEEVLIKNFFIHYSPDGEILQGDHQSHRTTADESIVDGSDVLRNDLLLEDENGVLWWGQYPEQWTEFHFTEIEWDDAGFAAWPWLLGALGGVGGILLAAGGKKNAAPVAVNDEGTGEEDGGPITGNLLTNDSDPDRDTLKVTSFSVNGKTGQAGETVVIDDVGTITIQSNGDYVFTPVPNYNGTVPPIQYSISDGSKTASATLTITVTPVVDLAAEDDGNRTDEDTPVNGTVAPNDVTTSGGTLTFAKTTNPSNGSVTMNADGSYVYTPDRNFHGEDSFTYTVIDEDSGEDLTRTVTITVNPVVDLLAEDDVNSTDEDTPVNGTVATNDSTSSGGALTYEKTTEPSHGSVEFEPDGSYVYTPDRNFHGEDSFTYTVIDEDSGEELTRTVTITVNPVVDLVAEDDVNSTDEDTPVNGTVATNDSTSSGGALTYEKTTEPSHGSVEFEPDGSYVYTPDRNFHGEDSFTYTVTDVASGEELTRTVTITVNPVVDLLAEDDVNSTDEDTPVNGTVATNDSTSSGGALTYEKTTEPSHGSVEFEPDGSYVYTPDRNFHGEDSFTYTVIDEDSGEELTRTVTITVNPVVDLLAEDDVNSTDEDTPVNGTVADNDSTSSGGTLTFAKETDPSHGTVVVRTDGTYTYTPDRNFHGEDSFTYTVIDEDSGEELTRTVTITVNPVVDLLAENDVNSTDEDTPVNGTVADNDSTSSGGTLTFAKETDPSHGTVVVRTDGTYTYTPDRNFHGEDSFTYTVTDVASGEELTRTVTITVNPVVDLLAENDVNSTDEDTPVNGTVADNDSTSSGGTLTYEKTTEPSHGSVEFEPDGSYVYTPDRNFHGEDSFTYTVTDVASGEELTRTVTITVNPVNDAPVIAEGNATADVVEAGLQSDRTIDLGEPRASGSFTATDVDDDTLTWSVLDPNTSYGTFTIDPSSGEWEYVLNNELPAVQALNDGDPVTLTFDVQVSDSNGGTATRTVTINITGTNDAPTANADEKSVVESGVAAQDGVPDSQNTPTDGISTATGNVLTNDTDVDDGEKATLTAVPQSVNGIYGTLVLNADGSYIYTLDNNRAATQALGQGVPAQDVFDYVVSDVHGATHSSTLTINITGTNDRPEIDADESVVVGAVTERGTANPLQAQTTTGTVKATDVDAVAEDDLVWSVPDPQGRYGTLSIDPDTGEWTYTLDNSLQATQELNDGDAEPDEIVVRVTDEHGAYRDVTITVTVNGSNDLSVGLGNQEITLNEDSVASGSIQDYVIDVDDTVIVTGFTIDADGDGTPESYLPGENKTLYDAEGNILGTVTMAANGDYSFTPAEHYSGAVPSLTYTVREQGGTHSITQKLDFTIEPMSDAPRFPEESTVNVLEDNRIVLGLAKPVITDTGTGTSNGDVPERIGAITLAVSGAGAVGVTFDKGGQILTPVNGQLTIVLTGVSHVTGLPAADPLTGVHYMNETEYLALKAVPAAESGKNFTVTASATSYEVDASGNILTDVPGASSSQTVEVDVEAVTDGATLGKAAGTPENPQINEDSIYALTDKLTATLDNGDGNSSTDTDGSETYWFEVSGLPIGSRVYIDETWTDITTADQVVKSGVTTSLTIPPMSVAPPEHFSGELPPFTVTLKSQDVDGDSNVITAVSSSSVTFELDVLPVANDISVGNVTTAEDTAVNFLANVSVTDENGGGEEVINSISFTIPTGWTVTAPAGSEGWTYSVDAGRATIKFNDDSNADTVLDEAQREAILDGFTAKPPLHSSLETTISLSITTTDNAIINGALVPDEQTRDHNVTITVNPVAETNDPDAANGGIRYVTMNPSHAYSDAGKEDQWFALGTNYNEAANEDGGFAQLGDWTNDDSDEYTYAVLTPTLTTGGVDDSVIDTTFRFSTDGGTTWISQAYVGEPIWIPAPYLNTLQVKLPPDVAGTLKIDVQAGTVDFSDNLEVNQSAADRQAQYLNPPIRYQEPANGVGAGSFVSTNSNAVIQVSGSSELTLIEFEPVADEVTIALNGSAYGLEDTEIPLNIRTTTSDPTETINVTIGDIPIGATVTYTIYGQGGVVISTRSFTAADNDQEMEILDFDNDAKLTILPPLHKNDDFTLKISAVSDDGGEKLDPAVTRYIEVRVQGVADDTTVVVAAPASVTEAVLDASGNKIALSEFVTTVTSPDTDGSEALTMRITGLDPMFTIVGATLVSTGTGGERVWSVPIDPAYDPSDPGQTNPFDNIFITVPKNFSGQVSMEVAGVSTEKDGDSLTGSRIPTGTPLIVTKDVLPSIDATITTEFELTEDAISPLPIALIQQNGDSDEVLTEVYILVGYDSTDYTLYLGTEPLATSGVTTTPIGGLDYYVIPADQLSSLGVLPVENKDGSVRDLPIKYLVTDPATLGPVADGTEMKDAALTFTVNPVTDPVAVDIVTIDLGGNAQGIVTPAVESDPASRFTVEVTHSGTVNVRINATSDDADGSEQVTRVLIQNVPEGVTISGASMIGNGEWLLIYPAQDPINGDEDAVIGIDGQTIDLEFVVGIGTSAGLSDVKITVSSQDRGTAEPILQDEINFSLDVALADGETYVPASIDDWSFKALTGTEDTHFFLHEAIHGEVTLNDSSAKHLLAITLTDLPEGSKVEVPDGVNGQLVEVQRTFVQDADSPTGKYVWTVAVEVPAGGDGQAVLDQMLQDIRITPPANSNSNGNDFVLDAQLKLVVIGGPSVTDNAIGDVPITPVTDMPSLSISTADVDEGSSSIQAIITGGPSVDDNGHAVIVDGKVYVSVEADANPGGILSQIVMVDDGEGGFTAVKLPLVLETVIDVDGVPDGDYYVVDASATPLPITLDFSAPEGSGLILDDVTFGAIIQAKESGAANTETVSATQKAEVKLANNGVDITVAPAIGNEAVLADKANAIVLNGLSVELRDSGELIKAIMLTGVPVGFLLYTGTDAADATLAGQATNAGGNQSTNTWILAENGELPAFIAILPPAHWSGTIADLKLVVASGESLLPETAYDSSAPFSLTVVSRPNGLTIDPTNSFGVEGQPILLNLNAAMVDNAAAASPVLDNSVETTTLEIQGLGEHAAFYVDGLLYQNVSYNLTTNVYTITGLTQGQLDKLAVVQAARAIVDQDADTAGVQVKVTAWTVESDTGVQSEPQSEMLNLAVTPVRATTGADKFIWDDHAIDGKAGIDSVSLRVGENVAHDDLALLLKNIENIDLSAAGANGISGGLTLADVVSITGKTNGTLTITGEADDFITLASGSNWTTSGVAQNGYIAYTSGSATLLIDEDILATNITYI